MKFTIIASFLTFIHGFSTSSLAFRRQVLSELQVSVLTTQSSSAPSVVPPPSGQKDATTRLEQKRLTDKFIGRIKHLSTASSAHKDRRSPEKAERLLRDMMNEPYNLPPNRLAYTHTIVAWSRSRRKEAASRAEALLQEMKDLSSSGEDRNKNNDRRYMQPSKVPYTAVITAWSKSRDRRADAHALRLLQEMKDSNAPDCKPNAITYVACISAVTGSKALELLDELKSLYLQGDLACRPDTVVYSSTIAALAKTQGNYQQALELLHFMEKESDTGRAMYLAPNAFSYSATIASCWDRKSPLVSLERAEAIVKHLEERFALGLCASPNVVVYNSLLDICSQCQSTQAAERALEILHSMPCAPDCVSYCTVIAAFSRSGDARCGRIAVELLEEMTGESITFPGRTNPSIKIRPNTYVYGAAIAAQAKCGDTEMAQRLFDDMERRACFPNTICYNSLISASTDPTRAQRLLRDMYRRYEQNSERFVKPNTVTFNTVLGAMASSLTSTQVPFEALALLEEMKSRTAAGEERVQPDHVTYSTIVGIWTDASLGFEGVQQIQTLLMDMELMTKE